MNAKKEFLEHIEGKELLCAKIGLDKENFGDKVGWKFLQPNYSDEDLKLFCEEINFEYDEGYGGQELFGIILFRDSFSDRGEYDGSEWWENHKMPTIEQVLNWGNEKSF